MAILIGGIIAAVIGAVWLVLWWCPFLELLAGIVPVVLILGGAMAVYFGIDEIRFPPPQAPPAPEPKETAAARPEAPEQTPPAPVAEGDQGEGPDRAP
jgi:hypothetical protein